MNRDAEADRTLKLIREDDYNLSRPSNTIICELVRVIDELHRRIEELERKR